MSRHIMLSLLVVFAAAQPSAAVVPRASAIGGARGCTIDEDCSLLGRCGTKLRGVCECDSGWSGADCGTLDLLPVVRGSGYNLTARGISSWGANIFPAATGARDAHSGTWHMLVSEFENHCDISHWSPNSAIVQATSRTGALGPYVRQGVAVPSFAHNPKVVRAPDGTWLMYTIGVQLPPAQLANCTGAQPTAPSARSSSSSSSSSSGEVAHPPPPGRNPHNREGNITLYTSSSVQGPWARFGVVLGPDFRGTWDEDTTNPSPVVLANGTVLLMYRGCVVFGGGCTKEYIGLASAPTWKGPYTRLGDGPILPKTFAEDPSMWIDKRGHYHFLMHYIPDSVLVARHAFARSYTGPWHLHEASIPYNSTVHLEDGSVVTYEKRERPHIVWDGVMRPAFLVTGAVLPEEASGYHGKSFTLIQEVRGREVQHEQDYVRSTSTIL